MFNNFLGYCLDVWDYLIDKPICMDCLYKGKYYHYTFGVRTLAEKVCSAGKVNSYKYLLNAGAINHVYPEF